MSAGKCFFFFSKNLQFFLSCTLAFSSFVDQGLLSSCNEWVFIAGASLVEDGFYNTWASVVVAHRGSSPRQEKSSGPGSEPMSSLAGRFLTTRPPGKYKKGLTEVRNLARDQAEFFFFFFKDWFWPKRKDSNCRSWGSWLNQLDQWNCLHLNREASERVRGQFGASRLRLGVLSLTYD